MRKMLLLVRVSKREFNKTLYDDYRMYMNPQSYYRGSSDMTEGQYDKYEGAIAEGPFKFKVGVYPDIVEKEIPVNGILNKDNHAYIFCTYVVEFNSEMYDRELNKFYHRISWDYIKQLWQGEETEIVLIKNTSVFIKKFLESSCPQRDVSHGLVKYDLQDKLHDPSYFKKALEDKFESIYHKMNTYSEQKEYRFAVIDDGGLEHIEIQMDNDQSLMFDTFYLEYGKDILIELSDLQFNEGEDVPSRFSANVVYYESDETRE